VLVAVANSTLTNSDADPQVASEIVDGLHKAGWVGGIATVVGAFFALAIKKEQPAETVVPSGAGEPAVDGVRAGS
jgi:hypothetical protein